MLALFCCGISQHVFQPINMAWTMFVQVYPGNMSTKLYWNQTSGFRGNNVNVWAFSTLSDAAYFNLWIYWTRTSKASFVEIGPMVLEKILFKAKWVWSEQTTLIIVTNFLMMTLYEDCWNFSNPLTNMTASKNSWNYYSSNKSCELYKTTMVILFYL